MENKSLLFLLVITIERTLQSPQSDLTIASEFTTNDFDTCPGWVINPIVNDPFTYCGTYGRVFGGFQKFGESIIVSKTFPIPIAHYSLTATNKILKVDGWDNGPTGLPDKLNILLDGKIVGFLRSNNIAGDSNQCGDPSKPTFKEFLAPLNYTISHFQSTVELKYVSLFLEDNTTDEAWGVREVNIIVKPCDTTCAACTIYGTSCTKCHPYAQLLAGLCSCPNYLIFQEVVLCTADPCGKCERCHISCKTCSGILSNNCLSCESEDAFSNTMNTCTYPTNTYVALQEFMTSNFDETEARNWNFFPALTPGNMVSTCGTFNIVGGYNILGKGVYAQRIVNGLPPHYYARLRILILKIDSWESETVDILVDGTIIKSETFSTDADTQYTGNLCGQSSYNEAERIYSLPFPHSISSIDIRIQTNLDSDATDESWGFSRVELVLYACDASCASCSGSATYNCLSCSNFKYFVLNTCVNPCPQGMYPRDSDWTCQPCDSSCLLCSGGTSNDCLACHNPQLLNDGTCVLSCPVGKFELQIDMKCLPCDSKCTSCIGDATTCNACKSSYYLMGSTCSSTCPIRYWGRNSDNTCQNCNAACLTCSLGGSNDCLSCPPTKLLNTNTCVSECPSEKWVRVDDQSCQFCLSPCATCINIGNYCTSCTPNTYLSGSECVNICPTGTYPRIADRTCQPCHSSCLTCLAGTENNCNSCSSTLFLSVSACLPSCSVPLWGDSLTRVCNSACSNSNQFGDINDKRICKTCDPSCATCSQTATNCTSCKPPMYLSGSTCVITCLPGFWGDKTDMKCKPCDLSCLTCSLTSNNCTSCQAIKLFKYSISETAGKCVDDCGDRYYKYVASNTCFSCHSSCLTCDGSLNIDCLTCPINFFLAPERKCKACEPLCSECYALPSNCTSCSDEYKLFPLSLTNMSTCLKLICNEFCAKCVGENICEACINGDYYLEWALTKKERVCHLKTKVTWTISSPNNPKLFELKFSNYWSLLFQDVEKKFIIAISNLDQQLYKYNILTDSSNDRLLYINISYSTNVTNNSVFSVKLKDFPGDSETSSHYLDKEYDEIILSKYVICPEGTAWKEASQNCYAPTIITPYIRLTKDPTVLIYGFDGPIPEELDLNISKNTQINIPFLNQSKYSVSISKNYEGQSFSYSINLNYQEQIKNNPLLFVNLNLTPQLRSNESLIFSSYKVFINVMDFYLLSSDVKNSVEKSADVISSSSTISDQAFVYSNSIQMGSSFLIKSLVINQIIQLMRFVRINYPPNVLEVFKSKIGKSPLFPEFNVPVEMEDGITDGTYYQNNISTYILNNCGTFLLTFYGFLFVGLALTFTQVFLVKVLVGRKILLQILGILYDFFVWNFPLSYLMAKFQSISFLLAAGLRFSSNKTVKGSLNMFFAIFSSILIFSIPLLIPLVISKMRIIAKLISVCKNIDSNAINTHRESLSVFYIKKVPKSGFKQLTSVESEKPMRKVSNLNHEINNFPNAANDNVPVKDTVENNINEYQPLISSLEPVLKMSNTLDNPGAVVSKDAMESKDAFKDDSDANKDDIQKNKKEVLSNLNTGELAKNSIQTEEGENEKGTNELVEINNELSNPEQVAIEANEPAMLENSGPQHNLNKESEGNPEVVIAEDGVIKRSITEATMGQPQQIENNLQVNLDSEKYGGNQLLNGVGTQNIGTPAQPSKQTKGELSSPLKVSKPVKVNPVKNLIKFFRKNSDSINPDVLKEKKKRFSNFVEQTGSTSSKLDKLKRNFQVLYGEYKIDKPVTHYFFFVEILRQLFITTILVTLDTKPLDQTIVITVFNFSFFLSLLIIRPYVKLKTLIQNCVVEGLLFLTSLGFLTLAILDHQGNTDFDLRMNVGWWICFNNIAIIFFMLIILGIQVIAIIVKLLVKLKLVITNHKNNRIGSGVRAN